MHSVLEISTSSDSFVQLFRDHVGQRADGTPEAAAEDRLGRGLMTCCWI